VHHETVYQVQQPQAQDQHQSAAQIAARAAELADQVDFDYDPTISRKK